MKNISKNYVSRRSILYVFFSPVRSNGGQPGGLVQVTFISEWTSCSLEFIFTFHRYLCFCHRPFSSRLRHLVAVSLSTVYMRWCNTSSKGSEQSDQTCSHRGYDVRGGPQFTYPTEKSEVISEKSREEEWHRGYKASKTHKYNCSHTHILIPEICLMKIKCTHRDCWFDKEKAKNSPVTLWRGAQERDIMSQISVCGNLSYPRCVLVCVRLSVLYVQSVSAVMPQTGCISFNSCTKILTVVLDGIKEWKVYRELWTGQRRAETWRHARKEKKEKEKIISVQRKTNRKALMKSIQKIFSVICDQ